VLVGVALVDTLLADSAPADSVLVAFANRPMVEKGGSIVSAVKSCIAVSSRRHDLAEIAAYKSHRSATVLSATPRQSSSPHHSSVWGRSGSH
jgi:hypothetical protein